MMVMMIEVVEITVEVVDLLVKGRWGGIDIGGRGGGENYGTKGGDDGGGGNGNCTED